MRNCETLCISLSVKYYKIESNKRGQLKVSSLFSGCGGLDLGFKKAGFSIDYANEFDKGIWNTFQFNFPETHLDTRSIVDISNKDLPNSDGLVGGPPCQSWSEAGSRRGIDDSRGKLFFEYMRILESTKPLFFLAENVSGILFPNNFPTFVKILNNFASLGYNVSYGLLRSSDFGVPQDRDRVIIVGYQSHTDKFFEPPAPHQNKITLKDAIYDLRKSAVPALEKNYTNPKTKIENHEFMVGGFSSIYMSRNRVRSWDESSFTIQAGGRHAPLHPQAPKMVKVEKDVQIFSPGYEELYRRLTVRECARIQTFPDEFKFKYKYVADGYKMVGNAVPVNFAYEIANKINADLSGHERYSGKKFKINPVQKFKSITGQQELKLA